jgi:hypothetical protein
VLQIVTTKPIARMIAIADKVPPHINGSTTEFEAVTPNDAKNERPKMTPGTFQVLVVEELQLY